MRFAACLVTILTLVVAHPARSQENAAAPPVEGASDPASAGATAHFFLKAQPNKDNVAFSQGSVLFKVTVAGRDLWGLLDNRSERSIIDLALAQSAGLEVQSAGGTFLGPLGRVDKRRVSDVPLLIPDQFEVQAPALAAVDLQPLSALHQREIGFVLGQDYLAPMLLFLDTGQRTFKLAPSTPSRVTNGPPPVTLLAETHMMEVNLLGSKHAAVLDLALGVPMRMSPEAFARLQPDALPSGNAEPRRRLDGMVIIGPMDARNPPVLVAAEEGGEEIAIGLPMFRNTLMLVDFGQRQLWLMPSGPMRVGGRASPDGTGGPAAVEVQPKVGGD